MSLADEALALAGRRGSKCATRALLDRLPEPDKSELQEALAHEDVQAKAIAKVLLRRGYEIGEHSLRRHRRGDCKCPP